MATEGIEGRTGRDGQSSRERQATRDEKAFAQTPDGQRIIRLEGMVAKLSGDVQALEQQLSALPEPHANEAHLRPTGAGQFWTSGDSGAPHWE